MSSSILLTEKTPHTSKILFACALSIVITLSGCGGGSSTPTPPAPPAPPTMIDLVGTVSAPGGSIAFNPPSKLKEMFASIIFGKSAVAGISGVSSIGAGATVELIEVDANGNKVGDTIANTTTDADGAYTLEAPAGFIPESKYVIRVTGTTEMMDVRVIDLINDVDPLSDAVSDLVTATASDLSKFSIIEINETKDALDSIAQNIDPTSLTAEALSAALKTEANNNEEFSNQLNSNVAAGSICGTVTNSSGSGLANIRIVARDFGNWVTRAKTKTAADGSYCLNVPVNGDTDAYNGNTLNGQYILGAFNRTGNNNDPGLHASEWWSAGGTAYNQFDAEVIAVPNSTPVLAKDFKLELGARIKGSVTAENTGAFLEGVKVIIRDFDNRTVLTSARVKADGTYRVNVIPGKYLLVARNKTMQAYASEVYDGGNGTSNRNFGMPVTVSVGQAKTVGFVLEAGSKLSGTIIDGLTSKPVTGMRVMVNNTNPGGPADRLRTNKQGKYKIWLRPVTYKVYAYGQRNESVDLTTNQSVDFYGTVNAISATLQDTSGKPVSQAKLRLYDSNDVFLGFEISSSDGSVTMHTDLIGDHRAEAKIDRASTTGGGIYNGQTQLSLGDLIPVSGNDVALGTIELPDGGVLTGRVYAGSNNDTSTPIGNFSIEVRDGGTAGTNRFTRINTRGDGSYVLSIPAGTYERVKMRDATVGGNCDTIIINNSETTTLNYFDGDNTCELNP